ncbi:MAG TPA: cellulase family glycosylhydrolase [Dongiaceae bacterium]|nr:cellulase family glycosylhydrolase [Dongiaceae bacterium]
MDLSHPAFDMRGGIGASWHALSLDIPLENEKYAFPAREEAPRGSGYGGNPPVSNDKLWKQLYAQAEWLGLDFLRVEVSQRMYEPERGKFDWDNVEMQALYHILDWCEAHHADVFLQQFWGHVEWNAMPGVHPLISAPKSVDDFGEGLATLMEHLVRTRHYSCIHWLAITNEPPGGSWGYWWENGSNPSQPLSAAFRAVRTALDKRGLTLPLSGPDWTDLPAFDAAKIDFDASIGAYDIHSYQGVDATGQRTSNSGRRGHIPMENRFFLLNLAICN